MHELNNIQNVANNYQRDATQRLEIAAGLYAANRLAAHMNTVEAQNSAMLHQMWVQTELMSGRSMANIQQQLDDEAAQGREASAASFWAGLRAVVVLAIGATIYVVTAYNGWLSTLSLVLAYVGVRLFVGRYRTRTVLKVSEDSPTPQISSGEHSQWVDDFRAKQAPRLKSDPPTD